MRVDLKELVAVRNSSDRIVLATGTFDLFHYEHLLFLQKAKSLGDILVVAIKDNNCAKLKDENRPIIDQEQRIAIIDALECVDYTVMVSYDENSETLLQSDNPKQKEWLNMFEKVFECLKPDILYHEENSELQTARKRVENHFRVKCISRKRTDCISTTKIINKIKNIK